MPYQDSFIYAAHRRSEKQQACLDLLNEFSFLSETGAPQEHLKVLREEIEDRLEDFTVNCNHHHSAWITRTLRALSLAAFGEFREAIALESEAMHFAEDDIELSKNYSNRGDYARRWAGNVPAGDERTELLNSAINDGMRAISLSAGKNTGIAITTALAFAAAGKLQEADAMITLIAEGSSFSKEAGDSFRTHLLHNPNLKALRSQLPSLERAYLKLKSALFASVNARCK